MQKEKQGKENKNNIRINEAISQLKMEENKERRQS